VEALLVEHYDLSYAHQGDEEPTALLTTVRLDDFDPPQLAAFEAQIRAIGETLVVKRRVSDGGQGASDLSQEANEREVERSREHSETSEDATSGASKSCKARCDAVESGCA
jgi:capsule polysaccharide export protein KpsE/RkpR